MSNECRKPTTIFRSSSLGNGPGLRGGTAFLKIGLNRLTRHSVGQNLDPATRPLHHHHRCFGQGRRLSCRPLCPVAEQHLGFCLRRKPHMPARRATQFVFALASSRCMEVLFRNQAVQRSLHYAVSERCPLAMGACRFPSPLRNSQ